MCNCDSDADAAAEYKAPAARRKSSAAAIAEEGEDEEGAGEEEEEDDGADDEEARSSSSSKKKRKPRAAKAAAAAAAAAPSGDAASVSVATKKSVRKTAKDVEEENAADESELTNAIYRQLAHTKSTPTVLAQEIIKQYKDKRKTAQAQVALINFMLQVRHIMCTREQEKNQQSSKRRRDRSTPHASLAFAAACCVVCVFVQSCGCARNLTAAESENDPNDLVQELSDPAMQSSVAPPSDRLKNFQLRWVEFWSKLVSVSDAAGSLYDESFMESLVVPWLQSIAGGKVRVWRRMATLAAFACMDALTDISKRLRARVEVLEKQMQDKKIAKVRARHTRARRVCIDSTRRRRAEPSTQR